MRKNEEIFLPMKSKSNVNKMKNTQKRKSIDKIQKRQKIGLQIWRVLFFFFSLVRIQNERTQHKP